MSDAADLTHDNTRDIDSRELTPPVICYRDPADVRTIRRQSLLIILAFVIAAIAVVGVVYKSIQRPDRIVVDMSSGRTVMINDRELGATEAVKLEKDKLQIADMDYVVKAYLDYLYRVDQRSRSKDIEAALRLMVPGQAKKFAQYLTEQKILQTQALERNKRAIVVRPGTQFVPPRHNVKAINPAATVTAQMRSGLVSEVEVRLREAA
jgi:hypothetical protein